MKTFIQFSEAAKKVHPLAVHVKSLGDNQYKVHAVGAKVNVDHVKPGDILRSSDLDDLSDAGHKVKELNEESEHIEEGMPAGVIKDKQRLSQMTDQEFAQKYKDSTPESLRAKARTHAIKDLDHYIKRREAGLKEEIEQVDELSRKTIEKYHDARWHERRKLKTKHSSIYGIDPEKQKQIDKIEKGLALAHKKMYKEEEEQVDESSLSTKTLANYSVKASAATTDKDLPANKTRNRYAGVSKVDKILSMRDKKKVD